jgi:hypothetical protein
MPQKIICAKMTSYAGKDNLLRFLCAAKDSCYQNWASYAAKDSCYHYAGEGNS